MTEHYWPFLFVWNADAEVLYFTEGDDVTTRHPDDVQRIYRSVSRTALMFVVEVDGRPIGECWLQRMNLDRVLERHPDHDCRRIDIAIGDHSLTPCHHSARGYAWNSAPTRKVPVSDWWASHQLAVRASIAGSASPNSRMKPSANST